MLVSSKSTSYNGTSTIEGVVVASLTGNVTADGNISTSTYIMDRQAFENNKEEVQKDIQEFQNMVYQEEVTASEK